MTTCAGAELSDEKKTELIKKPAETAYEATGLLPGSWVVLVQEYTESSLGMGCETVAEIKVQPAEKS